MKIIAYGDEKFSKKIGEMTVQISPLDYQGKKEVKYDPGKQQGQNKQSPVFVGYKNEELSVDVQIDCTGVIEGTKDSDTVKKRSGSWKSWYINTMAMSTSRISLKLPGGRYCLKEGLNR